MHLKKGSSPLWKNKKVYAGIDIVGIYDCTGHCDGPHLHFEVRTCDGGKTCSIDPTPYIEFCEYPQCIK